MKNKDPGGFKLNQSSAAGAASRIRCSHIFLGICAVLFLHVPSAIAGSKPQPPHWVATWATANWQLDNTKSQLGAHEITLRQIVRPTLSGPLVRVELTNEFGTEPLTIASTHIALAGAHGAIVLSSANAMTFHGEPSVTIPPGQIAVSDPAAMSFRAGANLAVSILLPAQTITRPTGHSDALTTSYEIAGNQVGRSSPRNSQTETAWYFLKSLDVKVPGKDGAIVAFGDSITDGSGSTMDGHNRWVDVLAARLEQDKRTRTLSVVNEGIGGNRVLNFGNGPSALKRFNSDVLELPGVRYVILLESINDIGRLKDDSNPGQNISADELTQALTQLVKLAHDRDIKVILATLTPFDGAGYFTPEGEAIRKQVNAWIRSNTISDGIVDFAATTRDPDNHDRWIQTEQAGDQLHPSIAGHNAMGNAIDLKLFTGTR